MYTPLAGHQSMKKIWLIKVLIVLILVPLFPMHAHAQEKASYTFVGTHYPLVFEQDKNGQVHGLGFDILKAISNEMGKTFKILFFSSNSEHAELIWRGISARVFLCSEI